ncbi:MAG: hypothetical protein K9N07_10225 [Candidatus Cloacimonetes bacterium]|nr:hypothetical protein [Candidatus Cloacimonadota bacterium]
MFKFVIKSLLIMTFIGLYVNCQAFSISKIKYDFLNASVGQNVGFITMEADSLSESNINDGELFPFSNISLEVLRISNFPMVYSLECGTVIGLEEYLESDYYYLTVNFGLIREFEQSLSYKAGLRSINFMFSGGYIAPKVKEIFNNEKKTRNFTGGVMVLFRFRNESGKYEPIYTKLMFNIDKFNENTYLYRVGLNLTYDLIYNLRW